MGIPLRRQRVVLSLVLLIAAMVLASVAHANDSGGNPKCDCYWYGHWGHFEIFMGIPNCYTVDCWVPLAD